MRQYGGCVSLMTQYQHLKVAHCVKGKFLDSAKGWAEVHCLFLRSAKAGRQVRLGHVQHTWEPHAAAPVLPWNPLPGWMHPGVSFLLVCSYLKSFSSRKPLWQQF